MGFAATGGYRLYERLGVEGEFEWLSGFECDSFGIGADPAHRQGQGLHSDGRPAALASARPWGHDALRQHDAHRSDPAGFHELQRGVLRRHGSAAVEPRTSFRERVVEVVDVEIQTAFRGEPKGL